MSPCAVTRMYVADAMNFLGAIQIVARMLSTDFFVAQSLAEERSRTRSAKLKQKYKNTFLNKSRAA